MPLIKTRNLGVPAMVSAEQSAIQLCLSQEEGSNLYSALPFAGRRVLTFRDYREKPRIANDTGEILRT